MLSQRHRFHGRRGLKTVHTSGRTIRGRKINLRTINRPSNKPYRVAVVVSRKVHKSAVVRNRIRRRVYEIVRQNDSKIKPGTDLIFMIYSEQIANEDAARLKKDISNLLTKAAQTDKTSML